MRVLCFCCRQVIGCVVELALSQTIHEFVITACFETSHAHGNPQRDTACTSKSDPLPLAQLIMHAVASAGGSCLCACAIAASMACVGPFKVAGPHYNSGQFAVVVQPCTRVLEVEVLEPVASVHAKRRRRRLGSQPGGRLGWY